MANEQAARTPHKDLTIFRVLEPHKWLLLGVVGLLGLLAVANMALPFAFKLLVDRVFPKADGTGGEWELLWFVLPGLAIIYVFRNILFFSGRMISVRIGEDVAFDLRRSIYDHLQRMSVGFYRSTEVGKLGSRVMDDTQKLQLFIQERLPTFVLHSIMLVILLSILFTVNWQLAAVSSVVLPLHFLAYRAFSRPIKRTHAHAQDMFASAYGSLIERFLGMEVVKGFTAEEYERDQFSRAIESTRKSHIRTQRYHFLHKVAADLLIGAGTVGLLGFGAWHVVKGVMTAGEFFMFFGYVMMLYPTVLEVLSGGSHLTRAISSLDRVDDVFATRCYEEEESAKPARKAPREVRGAIAFDNVSFQYDGTEPVLREMSFEISPGEHVAVVGPSGSGKTTLAGLIPRFHSPQTGRVLIDGLDAREWSVQDLRNGVGIAFQEVFLFNKSIFENLLYAHPDATVEEVVDSCRISGAHEFIEKLPMGYGSTPSELGGVLSRGEQQRITLARAVLKKPRILILDEATASLDGQTAHRTMREILTTMRDSTVIIITHDPEIADMADRVIAIDNGAVDESLCRVNRKRTSDDQDDRLDVVFPDKGRIASHLPMLATALSTAMILLGGCVSEPLEMSRTLDFETPRVSAGVYAERDSADELDKIVDELESRVFARPSIESARPDAIARDAERLLDTHSAFNGATRIPMPAEAGRLVTLEKLSRTELNELIDALVLKYETVYGYGPASAALADYLPPLPQGVARGDLLARSDVDGLHLIRLGYRTYLSRPAQLWAFGVVIDDDVAEINIDLKAIDPTVEEAMKSVYAVKEGLGAIDLQSEIIQLSYVDTTAALKALSGLGMNVVVGDAQMPKEMAFNTLPLVTAMPAPSQDSLSLVGGTDQVQRDSQGVTLIPSVASEMSNETVSGPTSQLLVLYHPAHPEQFARVRNLLEDLIDVPARQVFIEGMVLEISEEGLEDLGVEWQFQENDASVVLGALNAGLAAQTLDILADDNLNLASNLRFRLRALVQEGKAEILSRPSVLTLDNRQATIRVGEDIPIAKSQEGTTGNSNRIAFDFRYIPTGILLNVRPRVDSESDQISMQIDTTVSSVVPGADLEIRAADNTLLASAPTISSRRVQTYARIGNNTPFIIGGLVSRDRSVIRDKVPFLGDLPLVGALFRAERTESRKTEVIIVLTPYVLPENERLGRTTPRSESDMFNSTGNELFRDAYRLREDEVFDLAFLTESRRLEVARNIANAVVRNNYKLADVLPFRQFAGNGTPGEGILVTRMIYEVVKNRAIDQNVDTERLIFFVPNELEDRSGSYAGYRVKFLSSLLTDLGGGADTDAFFAQNEGKALYMMYTYDRESIASSSLGSEPVPETGLIECRDREHWGQLLWSMNQPDHEGRHRYTILIQNADDLTRLRRAVAVKRIIQLNGEFEGLTIRKFRVGTMLQMPDFKEDKVNVIDAETARFFFYTEHYYQAVVKQIERSIDHLIETVRSPQYNRYLDPQQVPGMDELLEDE